MCPSQDPSVSATFGYKKNTPSKFGVNVFHTVQKYDQDIRCIERKSLDQLQASPVSSWICRDSDFRIGPLRDSAFGVWIESVLKIE